MPEVLPSTLKESEFSQKLELLFKLSTFAIYISFYYT
jgi:hypothetical protein